MAYHLHDSLIFAIHCCDMRLKALSAQVLRPYDLTPEQFGVLAALWDRPGLSQREIAEYLVKDRPNITRMIDRLQAKGLVRREVDAEDRRILRVHATEEGMALRKPLGALALDFRKQVFAGLTKTEQGSLRGLLDKLFDSLE